MGGSLTPAAGGRTYENVAPATGEVIGVAADASASDMTRAIGAARAAFDESDWAHDVGLRVRCLRQLHDAVKARLDDFKAMTVAECGSPVLLTHGPQVGTPLRFLTWFADRYGERFWQRLREELADAPIATTAAPASSEKSAPLDQAPTAPTLQAPASAPAMRPRTWLSARSGWLR